MSCLIYLINISKLVPGLNVQEVAVFKHRRKVLRRLLKNVTDNTGDDQQDDDEEAYSMFTK